MLTQSNHTIKINTDFLECFRVLFLLFFMNCTDQLDLSEFALEFWNFDCAIEMKLPQLN